MTRLSLAIAVVAPLCGSLYAQSPAGALRAAVAAIERLPVEVRPGVRYLSLYAVPLARRVEARRVTSYTLNALSRTRAIAPPTPITPTLVRLSISNYIANRSEFDSWSAAWEK